MSAEPTSQNGSALRRRVALNARRIRAEKELTQQAVADAAELDLRHVQAIEGAEKNITIGTLGRLAKGLGVDVLDLWERPQEGQEPPARRRGRPPMRVPGAPRG